MIPIVRKQPRLWRIFLSAVLLTLAQFAVAFFGYGEHVKEGYQALFQWDSVHYREIAQNGYFSNAPRDEDIDAMSEQQFNRSTNVAFFPGYPLVGRLLWKITGWPMPVVMTVTAQALAVVFWTYLLLLLASFSVPIRIRALAVAAVFAHPAAFFLITAYSESLFLALLLGYVFWNNREGIRSSVLAALHGGAMTLTRIHGVFALPYPLLHDRRARIVRTAIVMGLGTLGLIGFFAYCEWAFGHWDMYLQRQWRGWGIEAKYLFPFQGYLHFLPTTNDNGYLDPNNVSATVATATFWTLIFTPILEWRLRVRSGRRVRIALFVTAALLWYFYGAALATNEMRSFLRYALAPHVLMIVAYAHLFARLPPPRQPWRIALPAMSIAVILALLALQIRFAGAFMDGDWIA